MTDRQPVSLRLPCRFVLVLLVCANCYLLTRTSAQDAGVYSLSESELQGGLELVRAQLVDELKRDQHFGEESRLAAKLAALDARELGNFLGSMAGGDATAAFESIGKLGADHFVDDFVRYWKSVDFEGKEVLQYIPVEPTEALEIMRDLWWGRGQLAADRCIEMLKTETSGKLEMLTENAAITGIDWVLAPVTGGSPGAVFVAAVKLQVSLTEVAKRYQKRLFDERFREVQDKYNSLRAAGQTPEEAYHVCLDEPVTFLHVSREMHSPMTWIFEDYYRRFHPAGQALQRKENLELREQQMAAIAKTKESLTDEIVRLQQLVRTVTDRVSDNDPALKRLLDLYRTAHEHLQEMEKQSNELAKLSFQLNRLSQQIETFGQHAGRRNSLPAGTRQSITDLLNQENAFLGLIQSLDSSKQQLEEELERIRRGGKSIRSRVDEICRRASDRSGETAKEASALVTSISKFQSEYLFTWNEKTQRLLDHTAELEQKQRQIAWLSSWRRRSRAVGVGLDAAADQLVEHRRNADAILQEFDTARRSFESITAQLRTTIIADRARLLELDGSAAVYTVEGGSGKSALGWRLTVSQKIEDSKKRIDEFRTSLGTPNRLLSDVDAWLSRMQPIVEHDSQAVRKTVEDHEVKFIKLDEAIRSLALRVRNCADVPLGMGDRVDLAYAKRLYEKAISILQEIKSQIQVIEEVDRQLSSQRNALNAALRQCDTAAGDLERLLTDCRRNHVTDDSQIQAIRQATHATETQLSALRSALSQAQSIQAQALAAANQAAGIQNSADCSRVVAVLQQHAAEAKPYVEACGHARQSIVASYHALLDDPSTARSNALQRQLGGRIAEISESVSRTRALLDAIDPSLIATRLHRAREAEAKIVSLSHLVIRLATQIEASLKDILSNPEARQLQEDASYLKPHAQWQIDHYGKAISVVEPLAGECEKLHLRAMHRHAELTNALIVLTATRDQPAGESVGPLRANADAAEILTERASSIVSDIQSAAEQLQNWCSKKFSAPEDLGQGPSTNPNPQPIRDPNQPIVRGPAETVQPGLVPGLSGILEGIADGTSNTGEDSLGQGTPEQGPHDPGNMNSGILGSGILGSGSITDIAQSDPADSLPADMQDGPDLSGLLEGVRDGDQGLDDGSHFPSSRPPRDEPPGMSLGGPREPPPQDHDEDQQSWGRHRLVFIDPDSGQNKPVPLELTWQPDGENMATARLSLSAAAPHELRDSLRDEGVELPITISAKRTDGTFIGRGPDLDRMMQAFCDMLYSIDVGISAFFGLEPTDDPPRVLRSAAHFDVQANEIKMLLKVDYRQGTHRESHELPFRAIRF